MFDKFSHVMMYTADFPRAVKWYTEVLGFKPNFVAPDAYASLRHEAMHCRLDIHPETPGDGHVGKGAMPNFEAKDLDAAVAALKAKGVKVSAVRSEGGGPRFCTFWDADGNALGLGEPWSAH